MKARSKPLPRFKSDEEEAAYWDSHSLTDNLSQFRKTKSVRFRRGARRIRGSRS